MQYKIAQKNLCTYNQGENEYDVQPEKHNPSRNLLEMASRNPPYFITDLVNALKVGNVSMVLYKQRFCISLNKVISTFKIIPYSI
ncbi:unnamed protein product [Brugia timori]|uniref:Myosin motor domain-containing protein n=1 Tax=Brugia timori TaxID=42155 RepID=A0A0R3R1C7_9BILA|nr:unnamed protein product [Brugia timori]